MRTKEYYYGYRQYDSAGIEPFLDHIKEFLKGDRTVPVTKVPAVSGEHVFFTFTNRLYRLFLENIDQMKKPYECALKYGFRGYSRGGKNGIFLLRKKDCGLLARTVTLVAKHRQEILEDLDIKAGELDSLKKVKVVYHAPSGQRLVGVMNQENHRIIFLGFAQY